MTTGGGGQLPTLRRASFMPKIAINVKKIKKTRVEPAAGGMLLKPEKPPAT
jgi:hypothetical protein